ncbi:MAG: TetR/AcrR family transcriptional regulator [Deltaproteobacteria bacterium]|nr:TetR/AcrR family transcriptional regulator [Deltaproteobacteria bacterium]
MGIQERKDREKQQRRNDILDAAEKAFNEKQVRNTTIDDVAAIAELSKGTIYLYFPTKEELYFGVAARGLSILADMLDAEAKKHDDAFAKIRAMALTYLKFCQEYPHYNEAVVFYNDIDIDWENHETENGQMCHCEGQRALSVLISAIVTGIEQGKIRSDVNPALACLWLWLQLNSVIQFIMSKKGEHISGDVGITTDDLLSGSIELAIKAIAA